MACFFVRCAQTCFFAYFIYPFLILLFPISNRDSRQSSRCFHLFFQNDFFKFAPYSQVVCPRLSSRYWFALAFFWITISQKAVLKPFYVTFLSVALALCICGNRRFCFFSSFDFQLQKGHQYTIQLLHMNGWGKTRLKSNRNHCWRLKWWIKAAYRIFTQATYELVIVWYWISHKRVSIFFVVLLGCEAKMFKHSYRDGGSKI